MLDKTIIGFGILFIILTMLTVVYDTKIGIIFTGMVAFSMIYYGLDKSRRFTLEKTQDRIKSLVYAGSGYLLLTFALKFISQTFDMPSLSVQFFRDAIVFSQLNPALQDFAFLSLLTIGIFVPFIETIWLAIVFEFMLDYKHETPRLSSPITWWIMFTIGIFYVILHFTAIGFNYPLLLGVMVFGIITLVIIMIEGQMLGAILMHVIANTRSLVSTEQFASLFTQQGIMIAAILGLAYFLFTSKSMKQIFPA